MLLGSSTGNLRSTHPEHPIHRSSEAFCSSKRLEEARKSKGCVPPRLHRSKTPLRSLPNYHYHYHYYYYYYYYHYYHYDYYYHYHYCYHYYYYYY